MSEHYSLAKTPDLAKRVSTLGALSPQRSQLRRKEPETMADNEFRISKVPPRSALLAGTQTRPPSEGELP
jgi:hypothetical protein